MQPIIPNNSPAVHALPHRRRRQQLFLDRSGGANQSDAAGTNINSIVAQYKKTGTLPSVATKNPLYGDYTFPEDIHDMREAVHQAEDRFNQLPADVRSLCENDWVNFIEKYNDPDERESLLEAGLRVESSTPDTNSRPHPVTNTQTSSDTVKATETQPPQKSEEPLTPPEK